MEHTVVVTLTTRVTAVIPVTARVSAILASMVSQNSDLGVVKTDWAPFFVASVDAHMAGNFEGQNQWLGMEHDVVVV